MKLTAACTIALALLNPFCALAAPDARGPLLGQSVRLDHTSVGCGTPDALMRVAVLQVARGDDTVLARLADEDCRVFRAFHGEVTLWFVKTSFVPARLL